MSGLTPTAPYGGLVAITCGGAASTKLHNKTKEKTIARPLINQPFPIIYFLLYSVELKDIDDRMDLPPSPLCKSGGDVVKAAGTLLNSYTFSLSDKSYSPSPNTLRQKIIYAPFQSLFTCILTDKH